MSRRLTVAAVLVLFAVPSGQACSLALAPDFSDATVVPQGVIANIEGTYARFAWTGGQPEGLVSPFFSSGPVFSNDGRYVVHDDQEGLGADCSGHRYTLAHDLQDDNVTRWEEGLRPHAALADGALIAPNGLRAPQILPWGSWTPRTTLDWSFLPANINDHGQVTASRDGSRIAITTRYTQPPMLFVYDADNDTAMMGGRALQMPANQLIATAFDGNGHVVAVLVQDYAGPAGTDPSRLRLLTADLSATAPAWQELWRHDVPRQSPWGYSQLSWFGSWLVAANGEGFAIANDKVTALDVPAGQRVESFATNVDETMLAILARQDTDEYHSPAAAIHVYAREFIPLMTLQPGPEGWQPSTPATPSPSPGPTKPNDDMDIAAPSMAALLLLLGALAVRRRVK